MVARYSRAPNSSLGLLLKSTGSFKNWPLVQKLTFLKWYRLPFRFSIAEMWLKRKKKFKKQPAMLALQSPPDNPRRRKKPSWARALTSNMGPINHQ
jgi:hypothetical protein